VGQAGGYTVEEITMRKLLFILSTVLVISTISVSADDGTGGYAGSFLQVPVGARPTAMGGAYLGISDDGAAPRFNPAGLAPLRFPLLSTSYRAMKLGRRLGYVTAVSPVRGQASLGVSWLYSASGSVEARDADGYALDRDIQMTSHQFSIVFAKSLADYLAVGVNIDYLHLLMTEMSCNSIGFDFGAIVYFDKFTDRERREDLWVRDLQVGVVVRNVAKKLSWNSELYNRTFTTSGLGREQTDNVPLEFGLGISGRLLERKLVLASDIVKNEKRSLDLRTGAEYYVTKEFALRGGYGDGRFTTGTGYLFKLGKQQLAIDYAFSTDKADEGMEHIFSFDLLFQ
jgi:hypothetical protein